MSYITIYFGNKPVYLCDVLTKDIEEIRHHPDAIFIDELSTSAINSLLHEIEKKEFHAGIIFHDNFSKLKKDFFKHFKLVTTGGGLVKNKAEEILERHLEEPEMHPRCRRQAPAWSGLQRCRFGVGTIQQASALSIASGLA